MTRTPVYATTDNDGERIEENARIEKFATRDAAEAYIATSYFPGLDDGESLTFAPGNFADCWLKLFDRPEFEEGPFTDPDDLLILEPGQHPGGKAWWVTPRPEILVGIVISDQSDWTPDFSD